jgi:hypothetical protein
MTLEEQDNFLAAECIKRIRHELRELDAIASSPVDVKEIGQIGALVRCWETAVRARLSVRVSRKGKDDEQRSLSVQD